MAPDSNNLTKTQVDRLGERLRATELSADDLRLLDEYRRSFTDAYEYIVSAMRAELKLEPTGRSAKSTTSIRDKLKRESLRLSQMQDIAGCRVIVADLAAQDSAVKVLTGRFGESRVFDRREHPSHGYRAVHFIAQHGDRPIEVQIRTVLQHMWAELSEKAADVIESAVKYGGGPERWRNLLGALSSLIAVLEYTQTRFEMVKAQAASLAEAPPDLTASMDAFAVEMANASADIQKTIRTLAAEISK